MTLMDFYDKNEAPQAKNCGFYNDFDEIL